MNRTSILATASLLLFAIPAPAHKPDLDHILKSAMDGTKTPALGALVIMNEKVAEQSVRGVRRNDQSDPAKIKDAWLIGSDAKPMTAALIAKLVERGLLSWSAPLSKMLPDLVESMRPEYRSVTLTQLLSHNSGLPHDVSDMKFFDHFYTDSRPLPEQRMEYISRALEDVPVAASGTGFHYSNSGFLIAAAIAERATGIPYEDLMSREIFQPLGMTSAGYGATHSGQPIGHHAGKPIAASDSNPLMLAPAGNIHLSLRDWAKFCIDQLAGAKGHGKILSAASYHLMQTPKQGTSIGLAWGVEASIKGYEGPVLTHAGSDGNWYALVVLFPNSGNGALVVANAAEDMGGDIATKAALAAVLPAISSANLPMN